jgi:polyisoprenoid-binding protein YceI
MRKTVPVFLTSLFAMVGVASAATYQVDVPHTQIYFTTNHMGFSNSTGAVRVKSGTLNFDDSDWSKNSINVTLDMGSLQFGDATWNTHMSDKKFFNVAQFATATFVSTQVEKLSETTGRITGDFTLLGVKKAVVLDIVKNKVDKNPMSGKPYAGFSATGKLKRSDWGMTAYAPSISDDVTIRIELEAVGK